MNRSAGRILSSGIPATGYFPMMCFFAYGGFFQPSPLAMTVSAAPSPVGQAGYITYTVSVTNSAPITATHVMVDQTWEARRGSRAFSPAQNVLLPV